MKGIIFAAFAVLAAALVGCNDESTPSGAASNTQSPPSTQPTTSHGSAEHARLPIGQQTVGTLTLVATMDAPVNAAGGGEGAFDVVIKPTKPKAVRFWVGTESGEGSVKAKAEEETPDNWHTHAEVPDPLPAGSKFWVEVEPPTGDTFTRSFDLKVQ